MIWRKRDSRVANPVRDSKVVKPAKASTVDSLDKDSRVAKARRKVAKGRMRKTTRIATVSAARPRPHLIHVIV